MRGYGNTANLPRFLGRDVGEEWRDQALCAQIDPNLHFPDNASRGQVAAAKRICRVCPSLAPCREWAVAADEPYGIAGGLTPRDRDRLAGRRPPLEQASSSGVAA